MLSGRTDKEQGGTNGEEGRKEAVDTWFQQERILLHLEEILDERNRRVNEQGGGIGKRLEKNKDEEVP